MYFYTLGFLQEKFILNRHLLKTEKLQAVGTCFILLNAAATEHTPELQKQELQKQTDHTASKYWKPSLPLQIITKYTVIDTIATPKLESIKKQNLFPYCGQRSEISLASKWKISFLCLPITGNPKGRALPSLCHLLLHNVQMRNAFKPILALYLTCQPPTGIVASIYDKSPFNVPQ